MSTVCVLLHPVASVIVTVYVPANKPVIEEVVAPLGFHEYVYGDVPPDPLANAIPSLPPLQVTLVGIIVAVGPLEFVTMADTV